MPMTPLTAALTTTRMQLLPELNVCAASRSLNLAFEAHSEERAIARKRLEDRRKKRKVTYSPQASILGCLRITAISSYPSLCDGMNTSLIIQNAINHWSDISRTVSWKLSELNPTSKVSD